MPDDLRSQLNVRVSPASRANLDAASKRFRLGLATLVDRVLARPEAISAAVIAGFEAAADDGTAWRKRPRERLTPKLNPASFDAGDGRAFRRRSR